MKYDEANTIESYIEFILLRRSILQFKRDLSDISHSLDLLSEEQVMFFASNIEELRRKMEEVEKYFREKFL